MKKKQNYTPDQIQEWKEYLRKVYNNLEGSNSELASYFYEVYCAIGPKNMTKRNVFKLDVSHLLYFESIKKTCKKAMQEFIVILKIVIERGNELEPHFVDPLVWNSGLKDYLKDLLAKLTQKR